MLYFHNKQIKKQFKLYYKSNQDIVALYINKLVVFFNSLDQNCTNIFTKNKNIFVELL